MKGVMFDFVLMIIFVGFLMVLYIASDYAYDTSLYPHAQTHITNPNAQNTVIWIDMLWTYFPLVIILAVLIFAIVRSQKRSPYE